jgi:hypothetical protein
MRLLAEQPEYKMGATPRPYSPGAAPQSPRATSAERGAVAAASMGPPNRARSWSPIWQQSGELRVGERH